MQNIKELPSKFKVRHHYTGEIKTVFRNILTLKFKVVEEDGTTWSLGNDGALRNINEGTWIIIDNPDHKDYIKPEHYHKGGIDVIGFSEKQFSQDELKGFYRINCLKYITRYDRKGGLTDLKKADFYLGKLMEMEGTE